MRDRLVPITNAWLYYLLVLYLTGQATEDNLQQPPHSVKVEAKTEHSFTLSWEPPQQTHTSITPFIKYIIRYFSTSESADRKEEVEPNKQSHLIDRLQPGTSYTVYVTALYPGNHSVSAPKFIVSTLPASAAKYPECDCSDIGTASCNKVPSSNGLCVCRPGYTGAKCEHCADFYYHYGKECKPCSCNSSRSSGFCEMSSSNSDKVTCQCLNGHFGPRCETCERGWFPMHDRCIPCFCLSPCIGKAVCTYCPPGSTNVSRQNPAVRMHCTPLGTPRPSPQRTTGQSDGAVAVIAVVCSLLFIAGVAGGITCYRYRCQPRSPHPFWSIELQEEKLTLNANCDYQRLDPAGSTQQTTSNNNYSVITPVHATATVANNVPDSQSHRQRSSLPRAHGQHKYHCISI